MKLKTFCFIFARGGSKGIHKKNIKNLLGKPLIAYSINLAKEISEIEKIFVSTDDNEIAEIASFHGANIIKRPSAISKDDSSEWLAWVHAIEWVYKEHGIFSKFLSLPATAPLRSRSDVIKCLKQFNSKNDVILTITEANRNPWFNMVKKKQNGLLELAVSSTKGIFRRQDAPLVYDLTTVAYVLNPSFILEHKSIWDGDIHGIFIPKERALDIDTDYDFKIAEYLLSKVNKKSKEY